MEIRQLRYFRVVAEAGSFARGANFLRVAQPALSRSIAKLEGELGQNLFVRHSTGVSMTEAGARLYDQASDILARVGDILDGMSQHGEPTGIVRLGGPQTIHARLLVPVATAYLARYGQCELDLVQDSGLQLREMVSKGSLDMAIVPSINDASLHCTPLIRESFALLCPIEHRDDFGASTTLAEIAQLAVITTGYPGGLRLSIDRQLPGSHTRLNVRSEVNSASLLIDMVLGGAGFGLAPCSTVLDHAEDRIAYVPIEELTVSWSLVASYSRLRLIGVQVLEKMIVQHAKDRATIAAWPTAELISA